MVTLVSMSAISQNLLASEKADITKGLTVLMGTIKLWFYKNYRVQIFILEKTKPLPYGRRYSVWPVLGSDPHLATSV